MKARTRERSELFFTAYLAMSRPRNRVQLVRDLRAAGISISERTLARYAKEGNWDRRAAVEDAKLFTRHALDALEEANQVRERRKQLGRAIQGLAATGVQHFLRDERRIKGMKGGEIARLSEVGVRLERGEATEQVAIDDAVRNVMHAMIEEFTAVYNATSLLPTHAERARAFGAGCDTFLSQYVESHGLNIQFEEDE